MLSQERSEIKQQLDEWTGEIRFADLLQYHFGFHVHSAKPIAGVICLDTDQGTFGCKRVRAGDVESYRLLIKVAPWMKSSTNGAIEMTSPIQSDKNEKYILSGFARKYVIYPWIQGKKLDWDQAKDWLEATAQLAYFHKESSQWEPEQQQKIVWPDLPRIQKEEAQKHEIYTLASKWTQIPTEVDRTLSQLGTYYQSLMESIQEYDEKINGSKIREQSRVNGKLCHHNCTRKNWIRTKSNGVQLIDWNNLSYDVRTKDLGFWVLNTYRSTGSKELITQILHQYHQDHPIEEEEHSLIYGHLLYPDHYLYECKQIFEEQIYYETTACKKLTEAKDITQKRIAFASWYARMVKQEFNKKIPLLEWVH